MLTMFLLKLDFEINSSVVLTIYAPKVLITKLTANS